MSDIAWLMGDEQVATADAYTYSSNDFVGPMESTGGGSVPTSSWADGLKSAFANVKDVADFAIKAAKDLGVTTSNSRAQVATNNNRNEAAIVESKRAVQAAQAAPMFRGGVDLSGYILPLALLAGVVLVVKMSGK